jgi:lipopolysaccharide transport system permease protein
MSDVPIRTTTIEPTRKWAFPDLRQVYEQRDLLFLLARRDLTVRYKQTLIGVGWVLLQPLAFAAVYSVFLTLFRAQATKGIPYPVFALTGITMWLTLALAFARASESTISGSALISKLYFPRIILPIAAVLPPAVDFTVAFAVLLVAMLFYGVMPALTILLAPAFLVLGLLVAFGIGLFFSALVVRYRDIQQLVPFLTQVLLFVTPILYPLSLVPHALRPLMALNPFTGVIEGFRWAVLPPADPPNALVVLSPIVFCLIVIPLGALYFQRVQNEFADDL